MLLRMKLFLLSGFLLSAEWASASVIIDGTRVVYPQKAREVTVQLHNTGETPSLVQSWVDEGDKDATPDSSSAPFIITPPISRIEAGSGQALRLTFTGRDLPSDRESLFWLNVLEVPPAPESAEDKNLMQLAFRSRLKIFYRPVGLAGRANLSSHSLECGFESENRVMSCTNPTPYHISVGKLELAHESGETDPVEKGLMFLPFATHDFEIGFKKDVRQGTKAVFTSINDFGGAVEASIDISQR